MNTVGSNSAWSTVNPARHVLSDPNRTGMSSSGLASGSKITAGKNASCTRKFRS